MCKRFAKFLEKNNIISPFQAAYRKHKSAADHILTLHEIFSEYRYNKIGPCGGHIKKRLILCFLDLKKLLTKFPATYFSLNFLRLVSEGNCFGLLGICSLQILQMF